MFNTNTRESNVHFRSKNGLSKYKTTKGVSTENVSFATCLLPKSGSTTLMAAMLASSGFIDVDDHAKLSCKILSQGDRRFNPDCTSKSCLKPFMADSKADFRFLLIRHVCFYMNLHTGIEKNLDVFLKEI